MNKLQVLLLQQLSGQGGGAAPPPANIVTNVAAYTVGDTITATVTNGPGGAANTVGLYRHTDNPASSAAVGWKYLKSGNQTLPAAPGVTGGTITFSTSGLNAGNYHVDLTDVPFNPPTQIPTVLAESAVFTLASAGSPPVAVSSSFGNLTQNTGLQLIDVLAAAGTFYSGTPTITINSPQNPPGLGATVNTSAWGPYAANQRPRLSIPTTTALASCSVNWTLTHTGGAGSSSATASGAVIASTSTAVLVSEWKLDGTFVDSGPTAAHMIVVNGPWADMTTASMVTGIFGTSAYRGVGGAYATIPANAHSVTEMTLSLYYQRNSAANKHCLFVVGDGTQVGDLSLEVLDTGVLRGYHVGQDAVLRFYELSAGISGTSLAVGAAHRIDLTFGPLGAKVYLDGTFLPAAWIQSNTNGWNNSRTKYLGIFSDGVQAGADGAFDEIRLWDKQLTDVEIAALQVAQSVTLPVPPPVAVSSSFGNLTQNTGNQLIDVLATAGTSYSGTPTITINSQVPGGLGATVDTSGVRPRLSIPTGTLQASCSVTWTLTTSPPSGSSSATASGAVVAVVVSSGPQVPSMTFLPGIDAVPGGAIYVYDSNLGNGSGSSAANAKEIQSAINSGGGQTLVAIAASPGGTSYYARDNGLNINVSGATLMARTGDTVVIARGAEFAGARTAHSGFWESTAWDSGKKIWRSVSAGFGGTVMGVAGHWMEFNYPHAIGACPNLGSLQASVGLSGIWTNYGFPCACINSDGRLYLRFQIPYPPKMSKNNTWPGGGANLMAEWPGAYAGGQISYPITENPNDYSIFLARNPESAPNASVGFNINSINGFTFGTGLNSVGYGRIFNGNAPNNITFKRATHIAAPGGFGTVAASSNCGNWSYNRVRYGAPSLRHTTLKNWKFGGYYDAKGYRGYGWETAGASLNDLTLTDCTLFGFHDCGVVHKGRRWKFNQCTFYMIFDDGFQNDIPGYGDWEFNYCYFLHSAAGGPGGNQINTGFNRFSHCIFDLRLIKKFEDSNEEPYVEGLDPVHVFENPGPYSDPRKIINCTFIVSPDAASLFGGCFASHIRGAVNNSAASYHEYWNNIACIVSDRRHVGVQFAAWQGPTDAPIYRIITTNSKEAHDFCMIWRDTPVWSGTGNYINGLIMAVAPNDQNEQNFYSIAAWKGSGYFNNSKGRYAPGFHNSSVIADPQIPAAVRTPSAANRRDYRPRNMQTVSLARTTTSSTLDGTSTAGWFAPPSPWMGALNPATTDCPVGVQNS